MNKLQQQKSKNTNGLFSKSDLVNSDCFDNSPCSGVPFSEWHSHSWLQVLIAIDCNGYYQEKGKPVQVFNTGDVVFILPNVLHWHIAGDKSQFTDITIAGDSRDEIITWLQRSIE